MSTPETPVEGSIRRHLLATTAAAVILVAGFGTMSATTELSGAVVATGALVVDGASRRWRIRPAAWSSKFWSRKAPCQHRRPAHSPRSDRAAGQSRRRHHGVVGACGAAGAARCAARRHQYRHLPSRPVAGRQRRAGYRPHRQRRGPAVQLQRDALEGQKQQLHERVAQLKNQIDGLAEQVTAKDTEIDLIKKELAGVQELWDKNLVRSPASRRCSATPRACTASAAR